MAKKKPPGTVNPRKIPIVTDKYDDEGNKIGETNLLPAVIHQKISITDILRKQDSGKTISEIAKDFEVSVATINRALQSYRQAVGAVKEFKQVRGNLFADLQRRILTSITDIDIKKAPFGTKILALCQLYDKERLENDLSTANIATLHDDIAALKKGDK